MNKILALAVLAAALPFAAQAESNVSTTAASAKLNFKVVVPKVIFLQVGTGTMMGANATTNTLSFDVPAGAVGNGAAVAATGGDVGAGGNGVTVRVFGNNGNVTLNNSVTGPLRNAANSQSIPWSDIAVTPAALTSATTGWTNGTIAHPAFATGTSGGSGAAVTLNASNGVVRQEGMWTFAYANTALVGAGTYGATGGTEGVVTYTATQP